MSRHLLALLASILVIGAIRPAAQSTPPSTALFTFHSNPWVNLHHYARACARGFPAPTGMSEDEAKQWAVGVEFYKPFAALDLLMDDGLVEIKGALREADGKANLEGISIDARLRATLEGLMPIYRKHAWPEHDRANRAWIAAVQPLLARHGAAISQAVVRAYDTAWPSTPIPVDLVVSAGPTGAYTTGPPTLVTMASTERAMQGLASLEMLFHESSHSPVSLLFQRVSAAATAQNVSVPPQLWHAVLFYTAGELTRRELKARGVEYTEYADSGLYRNLCGDGCRDRIVEHWTPRLDGRRSVTDSLTALVASFK